MFVIIGILHQSTVSAMAQHVTESPAIKDLFHLAQTLNFTTPAYHLSKFRCCYCGKICVDALESKCKHLFCAECVDRIADEDKRCPMDSTLMIKEEVKKSRLFFHYLLIIFKERLNKHQDFHVGTKKFRLGNEDNEIDSLLPIPRKWV